MITGTTDNPAIYTQAVELESFVDFISSDWEQKEISSHFKNIGQQARCDLFDQLKPHG